VTAHITETSTTSCLACARGWEHCHGVWVEHVAGGECTEGNCDLAAEAHQEVLPCAHVGAGCCESADG
jgi:hypothetical protein